MGLVFELRRRNVFRMAVLYVVVAWLIMQVAEVLMDLANLPDWIGPAVLGLLAAGLPIALVLSWFYEVTPEGLSLEKDVDPAESITHNSGRRMDIIVISLLSAAVLFFAWHTWWPLAPMDRSIAVLPFVDISPDGDQEYFADGLSAELIAHLSQLDRLQVSGRASSFYFKERDDDLKSIGQQLSVSHVLEGSVRKADDELRITARLTDVSSGFQLWTDTYERGAEDVFAIQEQIAAAVATALSIKLSVGTLGAIQGGTNNVEAYDAYLAGNAAYQRDEILHAIRLYEQATELDPRFALAWAQMAHACQQAFWDLGESGADRWLLRRDKAISEAVQAAPESTQVRTSLAQTEIRRGNFQEARRLFDDIHGRDDESAAPYSVAYVDLLIKTGNMQQALWVARSIQRRDPMHPMLPNYVAHLYLSFGRLAEALELVERGYASVRPRRYLAIEGLVVALAMDQPDEIKKWIARWQSWYPSANRPEFLPEDLERLFDDGHSPHWLRSAFEESRAYDYHIINWAGYYGEDELALEAMWRTLDLWAFWTPLTARARTSDEFKMIARDAGLVDYWRQYGWGDFCAPTGTEDFECH